MKNLFIRTRINKFISLLESNGGTMTAADFPSLNDNDVLHIISILEASGCIEVIREWGGAVNIIMATNTGASVYQLERHDVWMNRLYGFVSGVLMTILVVLIHNVLL